MPNPPFHLTAARLRFGVNPNDRVLAGASDCCRYTMSQIREIKQLFHTSVYFLRRAKDRYLDCLPIQLKLKVEDVSNSFESDNYENDEKEISILISYLSSAAVRISTIYEVLSLKPPNKKLYDGKLVIGHIHYYLRDNIAHKEPDVSAQEYMEKRQKFIDQLSIKELFSGMEKALVTCKNDIVGRSRDCQKLAEFVRKYNI